MRKQFLIRFAFVFFVRIIALPATAQEQILAFTHVDVIDATGSPEKPDMTVIVEGKHIL